MKCRDAGNCMAVRVTPGGRQLQQEDLSKWNTERGLLAQLSVFRNVETAEIASTEGPFSSGLGKI
jgi:hypothetical protein